MKLIEKYLIEAGKTCFHCKKRPAAPRKGVCKMCAYNLQRWRDKKDGVKRV